jgi:hypothetical protein
MQSILNGSLESTIANLDTLGTNLSEPNVWDGNLAARFRSEVWPSCHTALHNTLAQLRDLHQTLNRIQSQILAAGGNQ